MALILISIPILSSPDLDKGLGLFKIIPFLRNFVSYLLMIVFFFLHYYIFFPLFYNKKKWIWYLLTVFSCCYLTFFIPQVITVKESTLNLYDSPLNQGNIFFKIVYFNNGIVFQFFFIWLLSLFLSLEERVQNINAEKLIAEVNYLKAKINPHFLFNSLNNIYSLAISKHKETPDSILKLSNLMRYIVTESENEKVLLTKELEHIENFVALQKLRMTDANTLNFKINGEPENLVISPIILINYIENAFKYGINPDLHSIVSITINIKEPIISLIVINDIVAYNDQSSKTNTTKEGMQNSIKRLNILYPNKYTLVTKEYNDKYYCELKIDLT